MNKLLSCRYNMDTQRVKPGSKDISTLAIDCIAVEGQSTATPPAQRAELDWLLWNKPLEYAQLVLGGGWSIIFPSALTTAEWKRIQQQPFAKIKESHLCKVHLLFERKSNII